MLIIFSFTTINHNLLIGRKKSLQPKKSTTVLKAFYTVAMSSPVQPRDEA